MYLVPIAPGELPRPEKLPRRWERPGDSLSAPGLAPLLRSVAPAASCASRGFWEGRRSRGEDEAQLAVRHDPDRDQVRRGPTQVRGWQWLRWEMSLCGPLRPALKA